MWALKHNFLSLFSLLLPPPRRLSSSFFFSAFPNAVGGNAGWFRRRAKPREKRAAKWGLKKKILYCKKTTGGARVLPSLSFLKGCVLSAKKTKTIPPSSALHEPRPFISTTRRPASPVPPAISPTPWAKPSPHKWQVPFDALLFNFSPADLDPAKGAQTKTTAFYGRAASGTPSNGKRTTTSIIASSARKSSEPTRLPMGPRQRESFFPTLEGSKTHLPKNREQPPAGRFRRITFRSRFFPQWPEASAHHKIAKSVSSETWVRPSAGSSRKKNR